MDGPSSSQISLPSFQFDSNNFPGRTQAKRSQHPVIHSSIHPIHPIHAGQGIAKIRMKSSPSANQRRARPAENRGGSPAGG